jgi:chromosome segregation ATPase
MKRILIAFLFAALATICWADDSMDAIQQQLNDHITKRADIAARSDKQDAKASDIKFVYDAWVKQSAKYKDDLAEYNAKNTEVKRQYELLQPALDNYKQRLAQHNANQCTEVCTNGSCDGKCAWYTAEKNQLDNNRAQLQQAYAPLDAQAQQLQSTAQYLDTTASQLDTIQAGLQKDLATWKQAETDLKAEWDANEAEIARLQALLAKLKGENDACFAKIPPACQMNPLLDDKCEQMHAACGKLFDGNK